MMSQKLMLQYIGRDVPCNGSCAHPPEIKKYDYNLYSRDYACGDRCVGEPTAKEAKICDGKCVLSSTKCSGLEEYITGGFIEPEKTMTPLPEEEKEQEEEEDEDGIEEEEGWEEEGWEEDEEWEGDEEEKCGQNYYWCDSKCLAYGEPCNGICLDETHLCDGKCVSTHEQCNGKCTAKYYDHPCSNSTECIWVRDVCNLSPNCKDGSDEWKENCKCPGMWNCSYCKDESSYSCKKQKQCIQQTAQCDGNKDCDDGSDEDDCGYDNPCPGGVFM
jgi:low-density lipoprotein receptor